VDGTTIGSGLTAQQVLKQRSRFQIGLASNLVGAVFNQGSTFAFSIIAANLLHREAFGKYGIVASTLVTLSQVSQFAVGYTATKYVAEFRSNDKEKSGRVMGLLLRVVLIGGTIAALGLLLSASWLAKSILKAPELQPGLEIGAGVVFLNALIGFFMGVLAGLEAFRGLARGLILYGTIYLVLCAATTRAFGLNGAFAGLLLSALFGCILLRHIAKSECLKQHVRIQFVHFPQARQILLKFALPAALCGLTFLPSLWIGTTILVRQPNGFSQMALFSAAYILMAGVLFIPNNTYVVGWSILNHHKGERRPDSYWGIFTMNLLVVGVVSVFGSLGVAILGTWLLRLFGKAFVAGHEVLLVMLAAAISQSLTLAVLQHLQSQERMWLSLFAVILPRDLILVALAVYLVPRHGALGLAWAYACAWSIALLLAARTTHSASSELSESVAS
jgi:O-antigen/teichoic acid export membrane protein